MKKLVIAFLAISTLASCSSDEGSTVSKDGFAISGTVTNSSETPIYLEELSFSNAKVIDTAQVDASGNFSMNGSVPMTGLYRLRIDNQHAWMLMLNNGDNISFNGDFNNVQEYTMEGSPDTKAMMDFMAGLKPTQERLNQAYQDYNAATRDPNQMSQLTGKKAAYEQAQKAYEEYILNFAENSTNPVLGVYAATFIQNVDAHFDRLNAFVQKAYKLMPNAVLVQNYNQRMVQQGAKLAQKQQQEKQTAEGTEAKEISMPDPANKVRKLMRIKERSCRR